MNKIKLLKLIDKQLKVLGKLEVEYLMKKNEAIKNRKIVNRWHCNGNLIGITRHYLDLQNLREAVEKL
jgi:hypothetical protein